MENDETQVTTEPEQEDVELEEVDLDGDEPADEPDDKDWKAEAMKYKSMAKRYKGKLETPKPVAEPKKPLETKEEKPDVSDRITRLEQSEKKREFGYQYGLSPEETDMVFKFNPNPTKEDLDNPFVKGGLQAIRANQKQKENTPSSGSVAPTFKGKSFNELSEEEKEANFGKFMEGKLKNR